MKRVPYSILILLLAVLLLAVIFLGLDFKAAFSTTSDDTQMTTINSKDGFAEDPPLLIFVQAPDNLAKPLRQALFNRVGTIAPFSTMAITETPASEPGSAALVVAVDPRAYLWTPVYAAVNLSVRVAFASDGKVDWKHLGEIETVMQTSSTARISGAMQIRDRSLGLISHPGYQSYLANQISEKVVESIKSALTNSNP